VIRGVHHGLDGFFALLTDCGGSAPISVEVLSDAVEVLALFA
jgi:hypothetical protein